MNEKRKGNRTKRLRKVLVIAAAGLLLLVGGSCLYVQDYYHAVPETTVAYAKPDDSGILIQTEGDLTILTPIEPSGKGFIFYPGGKVEETAYLPFLEKLAHRGVTCVLVKMPFRLAVFGMDRADSVWARVPDIQQWYIGGHSLGGAMASSYAGKHPDKLTGLVLLAAYPTQPVELPTIALYGSEDEVLNRDKLKGITHIVEIPGGNHAWFGNYGEQAGDGTATITHDEQQEQSVRAICTFMGIA